MESACRLLCLLLLVLVTGCASIDFDRPKPSSNSVSTEVDSKLKELLAEGIYDHPGQSGFHLLRDGIDALAARVAMADLAQHTLDAQYYLVYKDPIGYIFLRALLRAADRGVRVRLLVDDALTKGTDPGLLALDSHPNIEVRLFNPFSYRNMRSLNLPGLLRLNRRMHNKAFIADNQLAIIGGRNIGKEYFAASQTTNFGDLDVLTGGPLVDDTSKMFDSYWNHRKAVPIAYVIRPPREPEQALGIFREQAATAIATLEETPYADAAVASYGTYFNDERNMLGWGPAQLIFDSPDKAVRSEASEAEKMADQLRTSAFGAISQLIVISPYFVPSKRVLQQMTSMVESGVDVVVVTNSLASNNHTLVHSGYAPKRRPLLQAGVRIFEVKPEGYTKNNKKAGLGATRSTLHTKAVLVDEELFFLGSFNWDPRSTHINTEMGAVILSQEVIATVRDILDRKERVAAYELQLDDSGKLRWLDHQGDELKVWTREPETGFWRRFWAGFLGILPLDSQL